MPLGTLYRTSEANSYQSNRLDSCVFIDLWRIKWGEVSLTTECVTDLAKVLVIAFIKLDEYLSSKILIYVTNIINFLQVNDILIEKLFMPRLTMSNSVDL